jgi:choline dehydrogenase
MAVDVLVVGAGTAGCVVTRRLLDAGLTVQLLEAGPEASHPAGAVATAEQEAIADPVRMHELWDSEVDWGYRTVQQEHAHQRTLHLPRGRVVGGSHALNGMIWVRGHPADYDTWAYLGNTGWSWADVQPVFRRVEAVQEVVSGYEPLPVQRAIVEAATQYGIPFNADYNSGTPDGVSFTQLTVRDGRRLTTAQAYLDPVRDNPRLRVTPSARVNRLLLSGTRCVGVEWDTAGVRYREYAEQVVLSAGALGSPLILQRSGVGDPELLRGLGIDVAVGLRGVGRNLSDHWLVPVVFGATREILPPDGLPTCQSHLFWRSRPQLASPDLQPVHFAVPLVAEWMTPPAYGFTLLAGLVRPASRGTVRIAAADPDRAPLIDPRVLSAPEDLDRLATAVELCRAIGAQPALAEGWGARERYPESLAATPELARDYIRETVLTYHHQAGTCAMGRHEDAVVDPQLRVYGMSGLTVADASVMPLVTTGNTNAPAAMIGERAADFLLSTGPRSGASLATGSEEVPALGSANA